MIGNVQKHNTCINMAHTFRQNVSCVQQDLQYGDISSRCLLKAKSCKWSDSSVPLTDNDAQKIFYADSMKCSVLVV
jgi:hypothetical protein